MNSTAERAGALVWIDAACDGPMHTCYNRHPLCTPWVNSDCREDIAGILYWTLGPRYLTKMAMGGPTRGITPAGRHVVATIDSVRVFAGSDDEDTGVEPVLEISNTNKECTG